MTNIISAEQLYKLLQSNSNNNSEIVIIDVSIEGARARQQYLEEHIKDAIFFDVDELCEQDSALPRMMPEPQILADRIAKLGIGKNAQIIAYDQQGMFAAARGWWMLKIIGVKNVQVLDGGLPVWKKLGFPIKKGLEKRIKAPRFIAQFEQNKIKNASQVLQASNGKKKIIDARDNFRFKGSQQYSEKRTGRIPNSINVPFLEILDKDKKFLPVEQLKQKLPLKDNEEVITSCGSGVTACILALAIDEIGHSNYGVYDGSWSEWSIRKELPVEKG